ncbi:MAG: pyruvate dehydrogenase (acetyl-transferring) E1 component subunit alpha [Candidatus Lambdaproteobacteria bacterium]|nr:pyruvate dehydrogenase (acetyl-transferring) E1 component subunit alpha [Candidatus Lambdaproteobacteria bacterium]
MYRQMVLIRAFEQRCEQMYQQRKIAGFLHLYMGQEALAVGMLGACRADDYAVTSYRDHGIALSLGIPAKALMAELFGKVTGVSRGKGGSMHFYSKEKNLLGGHGIVGGQIPIGLGAAFRAHYLGTDQVSMIFFGDGAINQGVFHEAANMASLWRLPAIFIVENNRYGMGTAFERASSVHDLTQKAQGYAMEARQVDGMNLLECYAALREVVEVRRRNPSPILIEAKTYRYRGHSISDPATYRSKEEVEAYQRVDPLQQVRRLLGELGWLGDGAAQQLERDVRQEVLDAVAFAEESPFPEPEERSRHVYAP